MSRQQLAQSRRLQRLIVQCKGLPARLDNQPLRSAEEHLILALDEDGCTTQEIADRVQCSTATVYSVLRDWDDTRGLARRKLNSGALEMTERLIKDAPPDVILRTLGKLDVVRDDKQNGDTGGVTIYIGTPDASPESMRPPDITITATPSAALTDARDDETS